MKDEVRIGLLAEGVGDAKSQIVCGRARSTPPCTMDNARRADGGGARASAAVALVRARRCPRTGAAAPSCLAAAVRR